MIMTSLVSITIETYNSSETILETLDSIYNQTYQNIELIIGDDCSKDDTIAVCREWIQKHAKRFVRTEIITVEHNTGVSANCNRVWLAAKGEWVKDFAGDDIMLPNCVADMVEYAQSHPEYACIFSKLEAFGRTKEENEEYLNRVFHFDFFEKSLQEQLEYMQMGGNCIPAPTTFFNRKVILEDLGIRADERIPMVEDAPLWINMLKKGVRFGFVDKVEVKYRLSDESISTTHEPSLKARQSAALQYIYYRFPYRYRHFKTPYKKLGEIRKYIHAASTAWNGGWKVLKAIDDGVAKVLNAMGCNVKV